MKILLLGGNGQVGWELRRSLSVLGDVVAPARAAAAGDDLCGDLSDAGALASTVRRLQPELIVNAAAYTAVDRAESEREAAQAVNAHGVGILADEAQRCGAWLVHYSTDYVFDGSGTRPWTEHDIPAPLNWYGATKLEGERLAQRSCQRLVLLRTCWVYASRGGNFARTMVRLACERDELKVVDDQVGSPTGADLIADVTAHIVRQLATRPDLAGLYHLSAQGETSWLGYARHVLELAERAGLPLRVRAGQAQAVPSSAFPSAATRPLNSRLDTSRLRAAFGLFLPTWQSGVERMLAETLVAPRP
jgi:dTDP-4-dehydrorhamnose reductase